MMILGRMKIVSNKRTFFASQLIRTAGKIENLESEYITATIAKNVSDH